MRTKYFETNPVVSGLFSNIEKKERGKTWVWLNSRRSVTSPNDIVRVRQNGGTRLHLDRHLDFKRRTLSESSALSGAKSGLYNVHTVF